MRQERGVQGTQCHLHVVTAGTSLMGPELLGGDVHSSGMRDADII